MKKFTLFLAALCCCAMMNAVNYSLTIAGTTVTDVNKTDVLGDGKVSFDPATNTLTLNNATIQTTGNSAIIWSDFASTLTIMLKGTNNYISMSGVSDYTGAIHTMGRLLITSEENPSSVAELKIVTSGTNGAPAIWSYTGDIIIENPISVNLQGAGNGAGTIYSQSGGQLIIDGATVYMMPCRIRTGGTVIARSAITSPSDAVVVADGRIMRSGTSSEYSKTTQVVISSNLRKLIYGATPKNVGNKVRVNDCPATESQAYAWIELADYINLTATPAEGYTFTGWYDKNNQLLSIENPCSNHQLMTENTTLIYGKFEEAFIYAAPTGALPGKFSVGAAKQIQFSQGNLQYQASTNTWRFAEHQYDMIGDDNVNVSPSYSGWIDLFGWGTGGNPTLVSEDWENYKVFVDWGTNAISNGGNQANQWHTLTKEEWLYIIHDRSDAQSLIGLATVNSITGIILLPDDWVTPSGLVFNDFATKGLSWVTAYYHEYSDGTETFHYGDNVYTSDDWLKMEAAGAVFLPAAGDRIDQWSLDMNIYSSGRYWSSSPYISAVVGCAHYFFFNAKNASVMATSYHEGYAVRLVQPYEAHQDIDSPFFQGKGKKLIKDGQLLIEKNGKTYNALGAEVK